MKPHATSVIPTVIYLLHVEVRGQLEGTGSLLLPCGFQGQIYITASQNSGLDKTASVIFRHVIFSSFHYFYKFLLKPFIKFYNADRSMTTCNNDYIAYTSLYNTDAFNQ